MDTRLTNYGWSGQADCSINESFNMVFTTEGYIINNNTLQSNKKKVTALAEFTYNNLDLGLILWYNDLGYMRFVVNNSFAIIEKVVDGRRLLITRKDITAPEDGEVITLKAEMLDTNIKCYLNDVELINIEQTAFKEGKFGIYGSATTVCNSFSIRSNKFGNWQRHIVNATSIDKVGEYVQFKSSNSTNPFVYIHQDVDTSVNGKYTISLDYIGTIHIELYNEDTLMQSEDLPTVTKETRGAMDFDVTNIPITSIRIGINTQGSHFAAFPQIERKAFDTSYTDNSRDDSLVTFPAGKINKYHGAFALSIKPIYNYATGRLPIFYYNDSFQVYYEDGQFIASYGSKSVAIDKVVQEGEWYFVSSIWQNESGLLLDIYDGVSHTMEAVALDTEVISDSDTITIGSTNTITGNLIVDNLVVYKDNVDYDTLISHKDDEDLYNDNVVIKSNFNKETLVYNKNKIAIPPSKPNSPIVIESANGDTYERVYFIEDGRYVIYNIEKFIYDGDNTIELAYDNLLKVEAYTENNDKVFHDVDTDGNMVTINDLAERDINSVILIKYMVKNTYCVNYDRKLNQYEVEFSNTDGSAITVQYEEAEGNDIKLIKTVEFNPFKSVNNSGFIYVEAAPRKIEALDVKITPDSLVANGYDTATISIDCLSADGIPTSNVDLEIIAINGYGTISKYVSEAEREWIAYAEQHGEEIAIQHLGHFISDEHRSGRFIYKYKAGRFVYESGELEMIDKVIVRDKISGIGIQLPIRLVRES